MNLWNILANARARGARVIRFHPDLSSVALIVLVTIGVTGYKWHFDNWLTEFDIMPFFLPWLGHLGDRLREGDLPLLNRSVFSGVPMAGDPESGWWYLPAMALFPFFEVTVAFKLLGFVNMLIAGLSTYAFARKLQYGVLASLFTGLAFELGPVAYTATYRCTIEMLTFPWLPVAFLGVEIALRSRNRAGILGGWVLSGFALSQIFAVWLGQGVYITLLLLYSWLLFRTIVQPANGHATFRSRVQTMLMTGGFTLALGVLFAAGGLIPRILANLESNIPFGDYSKQLHADYTSTIPNLGQALLWTLGDGHKHREFSPGLLVMVLLGCAFFIPRRRWGLLRFFVYSAAAIFLVGISAPLLKDAFNLLPGFKNINDHGPLRTLWFFAFPASMAAGIMVRWLPLVFNTPRHWRRFLIIFGVLYAATFYFEQETRQHITGTYALGFVLIALLFSVGCGSLELSPPLTSAAAWKAIQIGLIVLVVALPTVGDLAMALDDKHLPRKTNNLWGNDPQSQEIIAKYTSKTDPGGPGEFLQRKRDTGQPFRIVAYGGYGAAGFPVDGLYNSRILFPEQIAILQNGRQMPLGLETTQGYDPVQPLVYQEYIRALNDGEDQNYHFANVMNVGLESPLLPLLNVRYIVVPAEFSPLRSDMNSIQKHHTEVYRNSDVVIYERKTPTPRAWIVYQLQNDPHPLQRIADKNADPYSMAFVEGKRPKLSPLPPTTSNTVFVSDFNHDDETFVVDQPGTGFLVMSEVYSKRWRVTIDGVPVQAYRTNHALMGVVVPPGKHWVRLEYSAAGLMAGMQLSAGTAAGVGLLLGIFTWSDRRRPQREHALTA